MLLRLLTKKVQLQTMSIFFPKDGLGVAGLYFPLEGIGPKSPVETDSSKKAVVIYAGKTELRPRE